MLALEFDELSGTTFADTSGYGNTAAAPAGGIAAGSTGHTGKAVNFSGGVVTISGPTKLPDSQQVWIEAWVQPQLPLSVTRTIAIKEGAYSLKQVSSDMQFSVQGAAQTSSCVATTSNLGLSAGTWYHVAGWYDGLAVSVAVNGIVKATASCTAGPLAPSNTGPFHIGGILNGTTVTQDYAGKIDELRVYKVAARAYSAPYISPWRLVGPNSTQTFTHGLGGVPSQCRAYWSPNSNGIPKRSLVNFQNTCSTASGLSWQGADIVIDATAAAFYAYNTHSLFCYFNGGWNWQSSAYVQVICER